MMEDRLYEYPDESPSNPLATNVESAYEMMSSSKEEAYNNKYIIKNRTKQEKDIMNPPPWRVNPQANPAY